MRYVISHVPIMDESPPDVVLTSLEISDRGFKNYIKAWKAKGFTAMLHDHTEGDDLCMIIVGVKE